MLVDEVNQAEAVAAVARRLQSMHVPEGAADALAPRIADMAGGDLQTEARIIAGIEREAMRQRVKLATIEAWNRMLSSFAPE